MSLASIRVCGNGVQSYARRESKEYSLFGDRGYVSAPLTTLLFEQGLQLNTRLRKNIRK